MLVKRLGLWFAFATASFAVGLACLWWFEDALLGWFEKVGWPRWYWGYIGVGFLSWWIGLLGYYFPKKRSDSDQGMPGERKKVETDRRSTERNKFHRGGGGVQPKRIGQKQGKLEDRRGDK